MGIAQRQKAVKAAANAKRGSISGAAPTDASGNTPSASVGASGSTPGLGINRSNGGAGIMKPQPPRPGVSGRPRPQVTAETLVGAFPGAAAMVSDILEQATSGSNSTTLSDSPAAASTTSTDAAQPPSPTPPHTPQLAGETAAAAAAAGSTGSTGQAGPGPAQPPANAQFRFSFSWPLNERNTVRAEEWQPTLLMDEMSPGSPPCVLETQEFFHHPDLTQVFYLERQYTVKASFPRSFFMVMAQHSIRHCCVFRFPSGEKWWSELSGLRKSTYIEFRAEGSNEQWELHLKPSKDRSMIFGYIIKHSDMVSFINNQKYSMLRARRLPLVLDLDDTLVRLVGNGDKRYVPETEAAKVPNRVRRLRDGRQVVLTEYVEEFLEWASRLFDISVCSLGEQSYVDCVAEVLDPLRNRIRGARYSARQEYDFLNASPPAPANPAAAAAQGALVNASLNSSNAGAQDALVSMSSGGNPNNSNASNSNNVSSLTTAQITNAMITSNLPPAPPKDLLSLYAFCAVTRPSPDGLPEIGTGFSLPLILDDLTQMWPAEQHDNVIVVKESKTAPVWTVNLFPTVQHVLGTVHQEFFRAYDAWEAARQAALQSMMVPVNSSGSSSAGTNNAADGSSNSSEATEMVLDRRIQTPAKTQFLSMPVPTAIGCYKDYLRGMLREQISNQPSNQPPPHLIAAVQQQHQQHQQMQQQQQAQAQAQQAQQAAHMQLQMQAQVPPPQAPQ
ncbi:hypothetical protein BGW42_005263 [Actinomortierella wolfii]|nr:hypothetical protein BGW42_005263 [Actinomortierella wolfii]